jgi:hypothetical protein
MIFGAEREIELAAVTVVEADVLDIVPPCRLRSWLEHAEPDAPAVFRSVISVTHVPHSRCRTAW